MSTDVPAGRLALGTSAGEAQTRRDDGADPGREEAERFASLMRAQAPGAAMLAGMSSAAAPEPTAAARLVETLAERVLVGDEQGGSVRVLARDVGVPGLEVAVRREAGGLVVELMADHPADLAMLRSGAAELMGRLESRFGMRAEVRIKRRSEPRDGDHPS